MPLNELILVLTASAFVALVVSSLNRPARGVDHGPRLARLEGRVDQVLDRLGIKAEDVGPPSSVLDLARAGRKIEAIKAYRALTGASLAAAKEEVESLMARISTGDDPSQGAR